MLFAQEGKLILGVSFIILDASVELKAVLELKDSANEITTVNTNFIYVHDFNGNLTDVTDSGWNNLQCRKSIDSSRKEWRRKGGI
jgi:hypothetical protein